jgi:predicted transcriptional regulator
MKFLKDEQLRILKTMHEATNRMDFNTFAQAVNLEPNQAVADIQLLAKEGFLQRNGKAFRVTEKGKNALKINLTYPEKTFQFYVGVDKPLGIGAQSLEEFYRQIKQVCSDSLDFHLYRGDFENWIREVLGDSQLAEEVGNLKELKLNGEELRKDLIKTIDARYGVGDLL